MSSCPQSQGRGVALQRPLDRLARQSLDALNDQPQPGNFEHRREFATRQLEARALVGGDENARLDGGSCLSGWDNVRWIGIDARVGCASLLSMSAYRWPAACPFGACLG